MAGQAELVTELLDRVPGISREQAAAIVAALVAAVSGALARGGGGPAPAGLTPWSPASGSPADSASA